MNSSMVLYLIFNHVYSYRGCVCSPLTQDTKDILWIDNRVLTMTHESLAMGSSKSKLGYGMKSLKVIV